MKEIAFVFLGSGLGGVVRYGLGRWVNTLHTLSFPLGTFTVNIIACFIIGFLTGLIDQRHILSESSRLLWVIGFCGGFSTFSAFSSETLTMFQQGHNANMILYILGSVILCVSATFMGLYVAEKF